MPIWAGNVAIGGTQYNGHRWFGNQTADEANRPDVWAGHFVTGGTQHNGHWDGNRTADELREQAKQLDKAAANLENQKVGQISALRDTLKRSAENLKKLARDLRRRASEREANEAGPDAAARTETDSGTETAATDTDTGTQTDAGADDEGWFLIQ